MVRHIKRWSTTRGTYRRDCASDLAEAGYWTGIGQRIHRVYPRTWHQHYSCRFYSRTSDFLRTLWFSNGAGRYYRGMNGGMQLLCSTGAFSRFPDITDYQSILRYGPELEAGGGDGFEGVSFSGWTTDIVTDVAGFRGSGLRFSVVLAGKRSRAAS